jgi:hypothetical protein
MGAGVLLAGECSTDVKAVAVGLHCGLGCLVQQHGRIMKHIDKYVVSEGDQGRRALCRAWNHKQRLS